MISYYKEISIFVKKNIFNKDIAQDVTQETFTRAIKVLHTKNRENQRALLYRIAKNVMVDLYREKNRFDTVAYEDQDYINLEEKSVLTTLVEDERNRQLLEEIENLPKKRRQAFTLHIIDGYSREEVAQIMNLSINAVEQHISRATNQIKENIEKKERNYDK